MFFEVWVMLLARIHLCPFEVEIKAALPKREMLDLDRRHLDQNIYSVMVFKQVSMLFCLLIPHPMFLPLHCMMWHHPEM